MSSPCRSSGRFSPSTGTWSGDLTQIEPGKSYHLFRVNPGAITLSGLPVDPATPIPVAPGWNYLGYLPFSPIPVSQALSSISSRGEASDVIKGDQGTSMFFPTDGQWYGTITQLEPGRGYRLGRASTGTLTYVNGGETNGSNRNSTTSPNAANGSSQIAAEAASEQHALSLDPTIFEQSMSMAAVVIQGSVGVSGSDYSVAAYVGNELRGLAPFILIPSLDQYRAILTIYSNRTSGERVDFRLLNEKAGLDVPLQSQASVEFKADVVLGTIANPQVLQLGTTTGVNSQEDAAPVAFDLAPNYPNPFNPSTRIQYALPKTAFVSIEIYNIMGQKVETLISEKQTTGYYTIVWNAAHVPSGVYLYVMRAEGFVKTRKLLLVK